eukprot:m.231694 g.231694  ORF g.231694 m.231694 type:complete len:181 (-) comp54278_c5_seq6:865-1407(-)
MPRFLSSSLLISFSSFFQECFLLGIREFMPLPILLTKPYDRGKTAGFSVVRFGGHTESAGKFCVHTESAGNSVCLQNALCVSTVMVLWHKSSFPPWRADCQWHSCASRLTSSSSCGASGDDGCFASSSSTHVPSVVRPVCSLRAPSSILKACQTRQASSSFASTDSLWPASRRCSSFQAW